MKSMDGRAKQSSLQEDILRVIQSIKLNTARDRAQSIVLTKLEEAFLWIGETESE